MLCKVVSIGGAGGSGGKFLVKHCQGADGQTSDIKHNIYTI